MPADPVQLPAYVVNERPTGPSWGNIDVGSMFGGYDDGSYGGGDDEGGYTPSAPPTPPPPLTQEQAEAKAINDAIARENARRKSLGLPAISPILDKELWGKIAETALNGLNAAQTPGEEGHGILDYVGKNTQPSSTTMPTSSTSSGSGSSFITPSNIAGLAAITGSIISSKNAQQSNAQAASAAQVDIDALDEKARNIARQNALESAALEELLTPEVSHLRRTATAGVSSSLADESGDAQTQGLLSQLTGTPVTNGRSPLLQAAIAKAKSDLELGGKLSQETQNQVTRTGLAKAGAATGNLGLGRDVVARDLGLTSLDLENKRLANASQLGGQELQANQFDTNTAFNNKTSILNAVQQMQAAQNSRFGRNLSAAQFGQSIAQPTVGLDPSAVVNLTVGNSNAASAAAANKANIQGQTSQNLWNMGGQLIGNALLAYNNSSGAYKPST